MRRPLAGAPLDTHRGFDRGAARLARAISRRFGAPLHMGRVTRLVVDLNRSVGNRNLFSAVTGSLDPDQREEILERHYHPYRRGVERAVARALARRRVLHLSIHSFTPVLRGSVRQADIGLLYDPSRKDERRIAERWSRILKRLAPRLRVRRNYPYRGVDDGFIPHLRRLHPSGYSGIELEVNQKWIAIEGARSRRMQGIVIRSLEILLDP